jgi:hypothetical protein
MQTEKKLKQSVQFMRNSVVGPEAASVFPAPNAAKKGVMSSWTDQLVETHVVQ